MACEIILVKSNHELAMCKKSNNKSLPSVILCHYVAD